MIGVIEIRNLNNDVKQLKQTVEELTKENSKLSDNLDADPLKKPKSILNSLLAKRKSNDSSDKELALGIPNMEVNGQNELKLAHNLNSELSNKVDLVTNSLRLAEERNIESQKVVNGLNSIIEKFEIEAKAKSEVIEQFNSDLVNVSALLAAERSHSEELNLQIDDLRVLLQTQQTHYVHQLNALGTKYDHCHESFVALTNDYNDLCTAYEQEQEHKDEVVQRLNSRINELEREMISWQAKWENEKIDWANHFESNHKLHINQLEIESASLKSELDKKHFALLEVTGALEVTSKKLKDIEERPMLLSRGSIYMSIMETERRNHDIERREWKHAKALLESECNARVDRLQMELHECLERSTLQLASKDMEINRLLTTIEELQRALSESCRSPGITSEFSSWNNSPLVDGKRSDAVCVTDDVHEKRGESSMDIIPDTPSAPLWVERSSTPTIVLHELATVLPSASSPLKQSIRQRIHA